MLLFLAATTARPEELTRHLVGHWYCETEERGEAGFAPAGGGRWWFAPALEGQALVDYWTDRDGTEGVTIRRALEGGSWEVRWLSSRDPGWSRYSGRETDGGFEMESVPEEGRPSRVVYRWHGLQAFDWTMAVGAGVQGEWLDVVRMRCERDRTGLPDGLVPHLEERPEALWSFREIEGDRDLPPERLEPVRRIAASLGVDTVVAEYPARTGPWRLGVLHPLGTAASTGELATDMRTAHRVVRVALSPDGDLPAISHAVSAWIQLQGHTQAGPTRIEIRFPALADDSPSHALVKPVEIDSRAFARREP